MKIKEYDCEYLYEDDVDIVNIKIKRDYEYHESIDFNTTLILDLDKNYFPSYLEILFASKQLNVEKEFLKDPEVTAYISIKDYVIRADVYFKNKNEEHVLHYIDAHEENLKIKNIEIKLA